MTQHPPPPTSERITAVILAGGRGRRMGGQDKGLVVFGGRPLVAWVIAAITPQVGRVIISANRNLDTYAALGLEVVTDHQPGYQGPLAGMLAAMRAARTPWLLTLPCDGPNIPADLVTRLRQALVRDHAELAVASLGGVIQPVYSLQPIRLANRLEQALLSGERMVEAWLERHRLALADFEARGLSLANINSPEDAERLGALWVDPTERADLD